MPYVTDSRQFIPPKNRWVTSMATSEEGDVSMYEHYVTDSGQPVGNQRTYGWRTGRKIPVESVSEEELSGEEMRKEIVRNVNRNGLSDTGHPFWTRRQDWTYIGPDNILSVPRFRGAKRARWIYTGPVLYPVSSIYPIEARPLVMSDGLFPSTGRKNADGRQLISSTIPTAPEAGLSTFLGELREGLPKLTGLIALRAGTQGNSLSGAIASEYLNVQFGLVPFIADIKKMIVATKNVHKIFAQYLRDSDKHVRRRARIPDVVTVDDPIVSTMRFTLPTNPETGQWEVQRNIIGSDNNSVARVSYSCVKTEKVWFSGTYQYGVADGTDYLSKARRYEQLANKFLGTRVTAETIWELAPWSWLVDWIGALGTQISNAVALSSDNLVLRHAYVMHHTVYEQTWHFAGATDASGGSIAPVEYRLVTQEKARTQATPYGFGVSWDGFSLKQLSILAALGITRVTH